MKKLVSLLILAAFCLVFVGCYTFDHRVGDGAQNSVKKTQKQWFILWGLVPLTNVDSQALASGATDYDIKTQFEVEDVLISIITGMVTIYPQTVTVTK